MQLEADEIHIWEIDTSAGAAPDAPLTPAERRRAERYRFPRDRRRFEATRAALRHILARYTATPAQRLPLHAGRAGKPYLALTHAPAFNVSHSGERALIAVSHQPVGIDIERQNLRIDWAAVAETHYHPEERAWIAAASDPACRRERFYRLWTRKEAYLKGIGTGLLTDPASFSATAGRIGEWHIGDRPEQPPAYIAALATPLVRPRVSRHVYSDTRTACAGCPHARCQAAASFPAITAGAGSRTRSNTIDNH